MSISIRHARYEDVPEILAMIQELAVYEKEPNIVEATEKSLGEALALAPGTEGRWGPKTLIAFVDGKHAGIAMYFNNFSTWRCKPGIYLEELFVSEKYRRLGIGKMFLSELAKEVLKINGGRLEWAVLKWNKSAIKFYESMGAKPLSEWEHMRVERDALEELARRVPYDAVKRE